MTRTTTSKPTETSTDDPLLKKARWRTSTYDMPVADPSEPLEKVEAAAGALRRARATGDVDGEATAQQALAAARDQLASCYVRITFQPISSRAFAEMVEEHPPLQTGQEWNPHTFPPALIAACGDYDLSPEQWAEKFEADRWPIGERNAITAAALDVNFGTSHERYQQVMAAASNLLRG